MTTLFRYYLTLSIITLISVSAFAQTPPAVFFEGLDVMPKNPKKAKDLFVKAILEDSTFHGSYHFLGVLLLNDGEYAEAIPYFQHSILLNQENINHTREMAFSRLIQAHMASGDLNEAFNSAVNAMIQYPENEQIEYILRKVCLWSYYIQHNGLDATYVDGQMRKEYEVSCVDEEYLIVSNLTIDQYPLQVISQELVRQRRKNYDILNCTTGEGRMVDVKFRLNWNMRTQMGGVKPNWQEVYENVSLPTCERLGAILEHDPETDVIKTLSQITPQP